MPSTRCAHNHVVYGTAVPAFQRKQHREVRLLFQGHTAKTAGLEPGQSANFHHHFLPRIFSPKCPCPPWHRVASSGSGVPSLPCPALTTNEAFAGWRLGPQRPLELALWEEPVSCHSGLPGVTDSQRAGQPACSWASSALLSFLLKPCSPPRPGLPAQVPLGWPWSATV